MDVVSGIGLFAALIEISRCLFDFVQTAKEIHQVKNGLSKYLELESFTHNLTEYTAKIQSNPARKNDSILADLCSQMEHIANDLLCRLDKRRLSGGMIFCKTWKIVAHELMNPKQLEELEEKLYGLFDRIQTRCGLLLSTQSIEISDEINTKTEELRASISQIHNMLHAFAEESRVSRDNQHLQIGQRIEASTSRILVDNLETRNQIQGLKTDMFNEIRHNSRRQHNRNQFDYRVFKVGCLLYGCGESSIADSCTFRATGGQYQTIEQFSSVDQSYATNVVCLDTRLQLVGGRTSRAIGASSTVTGRIIVESLSEHDDGAPWVARSCSQQTGNKADNNITSSDLHPLICLANGPSLSKDSLLIQVIFLESPVPSQDFQRSVGILRFTM